MKLQPHSELSKEIEQLRIRNHYYSQQMLVFRERRMQQRRKRTRKGIDRRKRENTQ